MATYRLPLFPLQIVLLPEQRLPLHIFEERYKLMIGECMEEDAPFGIVLVEESGVHKVGCAARVVRLLEKFPDGRMNILVRGEERFELFRMYDVKPYFEGEVGAFHDEAEDAAAPCRRAWEAARESGAAPLNLPEDLREEPARLSFALAEALRLPLREKQALLESRSPTWRLERLLGLLESRKVREADITPHEKSTPRNGHP